MHVIEEGSPCLCLLLLTLASVEMTQSHPELPGSLGLHLLGMLCCRTLGTPPEVMGCQDQTSPCLPDALFPWRGVSCGITLVPQPLQGA
jgi:hypothetical protein